MAIMIYKNMELADETVCKSLHKNMLVAFIKHV